MVDLAHKGREFPPFTYTIERGKLREFLTAIGDDDPAYLDENAALPPTFATVFAFWGGMNMERLLQEIGVEMWNVLHGEQEYEYFTSAHVGDTVTGIARIADIYRRAGMNFVQIVTEYKNQHGVPVVNDRALIIVRE